MRKTLGEKISPVLNEIEETLWDLEYHSPETKPNYPIEGFRSAIKIFMSGLLDKMYEHQDKNNLPLSWRVKMATMAGKDIRKIVFDYTGIDCHNLYDKKK